MTKTLKTLAIATLLTGATVTALNAQTPPYAVDNVAVHWTVYMPDTATTNSKTGTITATYKTSTISTYQVITNLGNALGKTFKPGSTLEAISELSLGTNVTKGSNVVETIYAYTNSSTNITLYSTNTIPTNTTTISNTFVLNTNVETNLVYFETNTVVVATNITYYVNSGGTLTPLTNTFPFAYDSYGDYYYSSLIYSSFGQFLVRGTNTADAALRLTNSSFKGTIKTNLAIAGTVAGANVEFDVMALGTGNVAGAAGMDIGFNGSGNASAVTANVGKGKAAVPYSSWNLNVVGSGSGYIGGTYIPLYTNVVLGITNLVETNATVSTVYYGHTNAIPVNMTGSVSHTFSKIVQ